MEESTPVGDSIIDEDPVEAFRPGCTVAERRAAGSARGVPRRFETTLLDLVSELSDTLQDDERTVWLVAQLIREGWVRTSEGLTVQLSLGQASDARAGHRWPSRLVPAAGSLWR